MKVSKVKSVHIPICLVELATHHKSHYLLIDTLLASVEAIVVDLSTPDFMENNMEKQKGWEHVRN